MIIGRCSSELSGHQNFDKNSKKLTGSERRQGWRTLALNNSLSVLKPFEPSHSEDDSDLDRQARLRAVCKGKRTP